MPSYYTIAQYSPSPISDERINFGVLVFGDGRVRSRFLNNWERVRRFGAEMGLIHQFVEDASKLTEDDLRRMIDTYTYSIRFTEVRGSLAEPRQLLPEVASDFLIDPPVPKQKHRGRRAAADLAQRSLRAALRASVHAEAKKYLRFDLKIEGKKGTHYLDVGLQNERPRMGARGLSFEIEEGPELAKEVNATTLSVEDIAKTFPHMKVSVIVIPPLKRRDSFKRAVGTLEEAGATVIDEGAAESWAKKSVDDFLLHHAVNKPTTAPSRH